MIRHLRQKFTVAAMLSMFIVLSVLMAAINIFNYSVTVKDADETLSLLSENKGRFPAWMTGGRMGEPGHMGDPREDGSRAPSPELPFASRYFSALVGDDGSVSEVDTEHIAAVDAENITKMAVEAAASGKSSGFYRNYRFCVTQQDSGVRVTFLDCTNSLSAARTFLWTSVVVSLLGLFAVFLLMLWLSGRFTRPIAESYEKHKRFITDAGHEIKTPITIIDADAEVLSMDLPENEWLDDIRAQTKRLAQLTNDLLYLSRMDEEHPRIQMIDFPLSDMVEETASSFRSRALREGKTFTTDIQPMLTLCGDEKAIRQLVNILSDNALKYSSDHSEISLRLKESGKNVILTVSNSCDTVPEDLGSLFDRFYRADRSRNSSTGGHGLGLSIAQAVVNAHRGKITASAPDEKQMRFTVVLPVQQGKQ